MVVAATCNNMKMSLEDARRELEQRGFKIVVDPNDNIINIENGNDDNNNNNNNNNGDALVGYHSECVSFFSYKVDTLVFVFQIQNDESLTLNRINDDLKNYNIQKQNDIYDSMNGWSNTCPPRGWNRMTMVIVVYYANTVDTTAMEKIFSIPPRMQWNVTFLAVQDINCVSSFMVNTTPKWGRLFYPELQYWAGLLTGITPRPQPDIPPSRQAVCYILHQAFCLIFLVYFFYIGHQDMQLIIVGYILFQLAIALLKWLYQQRRQLYSSISNRNESSTLNERLL